MVNLEELLTVGRTTDPTYALHKWTLRGGYD